jgi:hypothetical protein
MISTGSNSANAIAQAVLPLPVGPAIQIGVRVIFKMGSESIFPEAFPHCAALHGGLRRSGVRG